MQIFLKKLQYSYIQHAIIHLQEFLRTKLWVRGGGHWGILETAKPKEKIIQNRKTAKPQKNSVKTENRIQNRQKPIQW